MSLNDRSESLSRTLPKLEIKEFEIHFFHITTIAIIVVEMYGFYSIYFQYKITGLTVFQDIKKNHSYFPLGSRKVCLLIALYFPKQLLL